MNFIVNFLTKDIWRKLIALTIACVLYLNLYEYKERDIHDVKVEINHDPDIFIDPSYQNTSVHLKIKGTKRQVEELALADAISGRVKLEYNADAIRTGKARVYLRQHNFSSDKKIKIVSIKPDVLEIPIQRKISRELNIVPQITGSPKPGKVFSLRAHPAKVTVSGPEQLVNSLPQEISTEPFPLDNDDKTFSKELKLVKPNSDKLQLSVSAAYVTVDIRDSYDITRDISVTVKYLHTALQSDDHPVKLPVPNKVSVKVKGNQNEVNLLTRNDITVFADLSGITAPGDHTVPLQATLTKSGSSVQVVSITPAAVRVTIREHKKDK
ncbi:MAG: hypothetical protein IJW35_04085 [Lentisphaeria bacterium]|nr:hypothetical protein [Lentisphaeria bacterium]